MGIKYKIIWYAYALVTQHKCRYSTRFLFQCILLIAHFPTYYGLIFMSQLFILGETIVPRKNTGWSPKSLVTSSQATSGIGTPQLFHKWATDSSLCAIHYTTVPLRKLLVTLYFLIGLRLSYQANTEMMLNPQHTTWVWWYLIFRGNEGNPNLTRSKDTIDDKRKQTHKTNRKLFIYTKAILNCTEKLRSTPQTTIS